MSDPRVIVALDYADASGALALVERLDPALCRLKVGKELFTAAGPALVKSLVERGFGSWASASRAAWSMARPPAA